MAEETETESLPAAPEGSPFQAPELTEELARLDGSHESLESLKTRIRDHMDTALDSSRRQPGLLNYVAKQTENMIALEQAKTATTKARIDAKHKRFTQNARLAELAVTAGGQAAASSLFQAAEKLSRRMDELNKPAETEEDVDAALEARFVGPMGTRDDAKLLDGGAEGFELEVVSTTRGNLKLVDDDMREVSDPPDGAPAIAEGEKAELWTDGAGVLRARRADGSEARVVKGDMIKPPRAVRGTGT